MNGWWHETNTVEAFSNYLDNVDAYDRIGWCFGQEWRIDNREYILAREKATQSWYLVEFEWHNRTGKRYGPYTDKTAAQMALRLLGSPAS